MVAILDRLKGKSYKTRLLNPHDEYWDRRLGVQTFGFYPETGGPGDNDWRVHYTPTPYRDIFRILRMIDLRRDDVFVDLGAGLGRSVFAASYLGAKRAIGVEVVPDLCGQAARSHRRSRLADRDIEFVCTNAQTYRNRDMTVLFMFHPFGEATMRQVMGNIEAARRQEPHRALRIIYVNPIYDAVLQETSWLKCTTRVPAVPFWLSTMNHYDSTIWQSR